MMSDSISLPEIPWQTLNLNNQIEKVKDSVERHKLASTGANDPDLKKACAEFESLFMSYLLKEMRATIPKSGFISGGRAEEIYTSMLDTQLAKELSLKGGIGLSAIFLEHLSSKPEQVNAPDLDK
jgi:flagellar protein FlgJ